MSYMKDGVKLHCLMGVFLIGAGWVSVFAEVISGLPIVSISDPNQDAPLPEAEIIVPVQRVNAAGEIIAEYEIPIRRLNPNAEIPAGDQDNTAINFAESILYDNTSDTHVWHLPGVLSEVCDFGTSAGGKMTKFQFGYVTASPEPITLSVRFYEDTGPSECPGNLQGGWIFHNLDGSSSSLLETFEYEFELPLEEQFFLPAGQFGYSYQFNDDESGLRLAMGGTGNEDFLWQDCLPISFSNSWAGAYMRIYVEDDVSEHCYDPPQYDADLIPSALWQTTGTVRFGGGGCRVYRMILASDHKYNFSLCSTDGVGGYCLGDADLEMFDADGSFLWYIDGQYRCDWAASTLGTTRQDWSPTLDGIYYLRVSDYYFSSLQYNLAYHGAVIRDPNLRVEPSFIELDCTDTNSSAQTEWREQAPFENGSQLGTGNQKPETSTVADPMNKLILADEILNRLNSQPATARVIVNLQKLPELKRPGGSHRVFEVDGHNRGWQKIRREIADKQFEVLGSLTPREFRLRRRFANLNSFSGEVTAEGLVKLLDDPRVKSIEPVLELHAHLRQGIPLMNALNVRTDYRGRDMAIAIVDTGIDYTHSVLGGGGFPNNKVLGGYDFGDDDPDPFAGHSHGTSCAGIAAGDLADVGDYIGGVAHEAKLYALKISPGTTKTASSDDMIAAWDWCVTHQYDDPSHPIMVINTSFGGGRYFSNCDDENAAMSMAAKNANDAGITLLVSAGNDGWCESLAWPACISNVISVGAVYDADFGNASWCIDRFSCADIYLSDSCSTDWAADDSTAPDKVAVYSNTASFLDILAPANQAYTTTIGGYVSNFGGTSAACPYAAGAVACLQSAAKNILGLYLTPDEVRQILTDTGDPITDAKVPLAKPRINLAHAVQAISCHGQTLYLYNDGEAILDVNDVITPDWVTLSPEPPYNIEGGSRQRICVVAGCNQCFGRNLSGVMHIYSNDPKQNAEPYKLVVSQLCPASFLLGDFDADYDIDLIDYAHFSRYWLRLDCREPSSCDNTDLNRDGRVNLVDLIIFLVAWAKQVADFNADGDVDLIDYAHFSRYWLRLDCRETNWCDDVDLNRDGRVSIADLKIFLTAWSKQ
jgi:hypothetical protein